MSYGSLYFGQQGFLYKKNNGVGNRRNLKIGLICNQPHELENTYISGSGVGASSVATRRAKKYHATACRNQCKKNFYYMGMTLAQNPIIINISLSDIALSQIEGDPSYTRWTLKTSITITKYQVLDIPSNSVLLIDGNKLLTNNGVINQNGRSLIFIGTSSMNNTGTININTSGDYYPGVWLQENNILNNTGTININKSGYNIPGFYLQGNSRLNNSGIINDYSNSIQLVDSSILNNTGTINEIDANNGQGGGGIWMYNSSVLNNNQGGIINDDNYCGIHLGWDNDEFVPDEFRNRCRLNNTGTIYEKGNESSNTGIILFNECVLTNETRGQIYLYNDGLVNNSTVEAINDGIIYNTTGDSITNVTGPGEIKKLT